LQADLFTVLRAAGVLGIAVFVLLFAVHLPEVSRLFLVVLFAVQTVASVASRLLLRLVFGRVREKGLNTRYLLVVGTSPMAEAFADMIESHRELGLRVVGHLRGDAAADEPLPRRPILGRLDDIEYVLHSQVVDEVAICLALAEWPLVAAITQICEEEGKVVRVPADVAVPGGVPRLEGAHIEQYGGMTIQSLVYGPDRLVSLLIKRAIDLAGASLLVIVGSPVLIGVALAMWVVDGRPILFRQPRVGLHGRLFHVLKFRTMVRGAEEQLADLIDRNEISGHAFKVTGDPRITSIGRFLRRTSLDELPQLWNVIRGEMSLVGPRPPLPSEVASYDVWHRRRLSMKPGITGLWQITDRGNPDFDQWVTIDLDYIDRWSLWLDVKIIARTLPAMLEGR
jgi:exopolysaccharide biosynthesis polyprenyl glycosylphosphotransferase